MNTLKIIAWTIVIIYVVIALILYTLQAKLIFYPGRLSADYKFKMVGAQEVVINTSDGERISGLFFAGEQADVLLYFHGNAGDLSGWQYVSEDFTSTGYNFLIVDYRGYGKSSGEVSEKGFYLDAQAAYDFLIARGFLPKNIIVYGRSIGSGAAVDLASKNVCKGLILESPYSSLSALANEKLPLLFPSLYLRYRFDNVSKIHRITCPVVFLHGTDDTLIPAAHSQKLFNEFDGRKKMILVEKGSHNDLHAFPEFATLVKKLFPVSFNDCPVSRMVVFV